MEQSDPSVGHRVILEYQREHGDRHFRRHGDLSRERVEGFRFLFAELGLEFSEGIEAKIIGHSPAGKPATLNRDSASNISTWKRRLAASEIDRIREETQDLPREYYTDDSWT